MINQVPDNWEYSESLEMLFLFYQCSDELLSESTPDSYALPLHNVITLLYEAAEVYNFLEENGAPDKYYAQYIPPIIEEFIQATENDYIFKRLLGERLDTARTGFQETMHEPKQLEKWLNYINQICTIKTYLSLYEEEIIHLVTSTKDKQKLLYCASNYYVSLRWIGFSREYLFLSAKSYFKNRDYTIMNLSQITDYLNQFAPQQKRFDFLILMDTSALDYMEGISDSLELSRYISKVKLVEEKEELDKDPAVARMIHDYEGKKRNEGIHENIEIVRFFYSDYDPYSAAMNFIDHISFVQSFDRYFKHFHSSKQVYTILLEQEDGKYQEIRLPARLQKRPYVEQEMIDSRIKMMIAATNMAPPAFTTIAKAVEMHAEALDSRSTATLLKTFWTALETLFANPNSNSERENVIKSVLPIIQKTYILKKLRLLYAQLVETAEEKSLQDIGIHDFCSFVEYYSSAPAQELRPLYSLLNNNLLLRSKLFEFRNKIDDGEKIKKMLEEHQEKVEFQLKRLLRLRNIATHLGEEAEGTSVAVNHLHNYFDYVINYMLCKSEVGDYVISTSSVVFEAKNDNRIHMEALKTKEKLSKENYKRFLFGPDPRLIEYQFEH